MHFTEVSAAQHPPGGVRGRAGGQRRLHDGLLWPSDPLLALRGRGLHRSAPGA